MTNYGRKPRKYCLVDEKAMDKVVSIHFCGGCNPRIERRQVAEAVQRELSRLGYRVAWNRKDAEFAIYLSGCSANCAYHYRKDSARLYVTIADRSIDAIPIAEEGFIAEIIRKVRDCFERLDNHV